MDNQEIQLPNHVVIHLLLSTFQEIPEIKLIKNIYKNKVCKIKLIFFYIQNGDLFYLCCNVAYLNLFFVSWLFTNQCVI